MGLIYHPNESQELVANFQANIATCEQILNHLKTGNTHLVNALNSNQLSGVAFTAGKGMFTQLVMPTVEKADTAIQEMKQKLQQYIHYTGVAGGEILDEDKLTQQLQELRAQQYTLTNQIRLYQNQALLNDIPELSTMYHTHANELTNFMNVVQDDIRKVEDKLRRLHELDMKIAPLFNGLIDKFHQISTVINALGSGSFDSSGKFTVNEKDKSALLDVVTDYGSGAIQDGLSEGISTFLENMDTSMPNAGAYMHAYASGNQYWRNIHIDWDNVGYGKAVSNSMLKKGVQNVTVAKFGVGKAKISGLGALGFGIDYLQNRNDGESVGMAFTHTAATTAIAGGTVWIAGATASAAATGTFGVSVMGAGAAVSTFIASNPVGWAICAGIGASFLTKLAYDNNFLGLKDGVKTVGNAVNSGLESIKNVFGWRKKKHA
ncbi:T7SS effector LXG polymorphic toxin [Enterococcus faecium]|uniref:T7SS effector LXG polymorphic toxin n=1 Tax=Enterococcus faecium TaxID=1352 RepID=UPI000352B2EA|nr:T7SS effector LXG polymorphic toxin [Enterococcus faecium]EPI20474.1 hypothetical protein D352_02411 [Enterococcus faecium LA4B-2]